MAAKRVGGRKEMYAPSAAELAAALRLNVAVVDGWLDDELVEWFTVPGEDGRFVPRAEAELIFSGRHPICELRRRKASV